MRRALALLVVPLLAACGNSNIGSVFDPNGGGGGPGPPGGGGAATAVPVAGGVIVPGNPTTVVVAPDQETGVSVETPIAVIFNETMDAASITGATLQVRPAGGSPVSGTISLFAANRIAVFVPNASLSPNAVFEVVVTSGMKDLEGRALTAPVSGVAASFTTETTTATNTTPSLVALYPPDGATNVPRGTDLVAVFSEPVNTATVWPLGMVPALVGPPAAPVGTLPNFAAGNRIAVLTPTSPLPLAAGGALVSVSFQPTIQNDDFSPTPFCAGSAPCAVSTFRVTLFDAPLAVATATSPANTVNLANADAVDFEVDLAADALAADEVHLLVHEASGTEGFETTAAGIAGGGTVAITEDLRETTTPLVPRLADGTLVVGAFLRRGAANSVIVLGPAVRQDTVAPSIVRYGPPNLASLSTFGTALRRPSVSGTASEAIGSITVTGPAGVSPVSTTGLSIGSGTYFVAPAIDLEPVLAAPLPASLDALPFTIDLTDLAGNTTGGIAGTLLARGFTGTAPSSQPAGTVLVAVYDEGTLAGLTNARVFLEPGISQNPPSGVVEGSVFASGVYAFSGVAAGPNTITAAAAGYELATVVATGATFVSIGLRPVGGTSSLATLTGSISGNTTGFGVRFTSNVLPDRGAFGRFDFDPLTPAVVPATPIEANRPQILTAFSTALPPTATFFNFTFGLPAPAPSPGNSAFVPVVFPTPPSLTPDPLDDAIPIASRTIELSGATGLNAGALVGNPEVAVNGERPGFPGTLGVGLGFTIAGGGPTQFTSFADLSPLGSILVPPANLHMAVRAGDTAGAVSEARAPLGALPGTVFLPPVPTVLSPAPPGPFAPSLAVTFADALSGGVAVLRVVDNASSPRGWTFLVPDAGGATSTVQVPVVAGFPNGGLVGLAAGGTANWTIVADAFDGSGIAFDAFSFASLRTSATAFSRSPAVTVPVQ